MTWVRLADDFADHPKILSAGPLAAWQYVCGLAYCNKHLTDGFIPRGAVRRLADVDDPYRLAATLVDAGLWESVDDGYVVHDYLDYQPSKETVLNEREKTAERVARWRERHGNADGNAVTDPSGNAVRPGVANGVGTAAPARPGPGPLTPGPDPAGAPPKPPSRRGAGSHRQRSKSDGRPSIPTDPAAYTSGEYGRVAAERMAANIREE